MFDETLNVINNINNFFQKIYIYTVEEKSNQNDKKCKKQKTNDQNYFKFCTFIVIYIYIMHIKFQPFILFSCLTIIFFIQKKNHKKFKKDHF